MARDDALHCFLCARELFGCERANVTRDVRAFRNDIRLAERGAAALRGIERHRRAADDHARIEREFRFAR